MPKLDSLGLGPLIEPKRMAKSKKRDIPELDAILSPKMKGPTIEDAYTTWSENQNEENMGKFIQAADPIIQSAVRSYGGATPSANLGSEAKLIIIDSLPKYDPNKGVKINTYLFNQLKGLIRKQIKEQMTLSVPERVVYDSNSLDKLTKEFEDKHGREPSDEELADVSGMSTSRIRYVRNFMGGTLYEGGLLGEEGEPLGLATGKSPLEEDAKSVVYAGLDPIDKLIFDYKLGEHGRQPMSVTDIGNKLKISPSSVSQRAEGISRQILEVMQSL
tara:strand:+ start:896 stop:1717 length:822 start_codon:yes stop_codon:yes gene_type:complete